jgi:hypothetical protein
MIRGSIPMSNINRIVLAALILGLGAAPSLSAQQSYRRQGFWVSVGGGYGSNKSDCQSCVDPRRKNGGSLLLKLGGTVSPSVLLGVESNLFFRSDSGINARLANLSLIGQWYPWSRGGFFAKGGVGLSYAKARFPTSEVNTSTTIEKLGMGLTFGAGYDIPVSRQISLSPVGNIYYAVLGDITYPGGLLDNSLMTQLQIGLALTFH